MNYVEFFSKLGFNFKEDLKLNNIVFEKNENLTKKLSNSLFYYKSPNNTNTSFYLITTSLNSDEIEEIRRYIWNKNDADLIFHYPYDGAKLEMSYAKYSPKTTYEKSILDSFSTTQIDLDKIEEIKHWQFESGVFWFKYSKFIAKTKYKGIDKELVLTLSALKKQLESTLSEFIPNESVRNENVQALIDRTLYIKYLEDNHIINSHFYGHYFNDEELNYAKLLEKNSNADLNKLFKKIHEIFNNSLFERPTIDNKYLTEGVRSLIASSFNANLDTGQLRLFHFQFDVLPVEFISYIYEVFLSENQKENGIYYTPKKLAQLIVDDVICEDRIGSILDPSSGSGMFLIVGFQRLLEIAQKRGLEPQNSIDKIKFRTKLLSDNIFGIEKELSAQRFTLFSLSLQIFKGIKSTDIKEFIEKELREKGKVNLFSEHSFSKNIKHANTLDLKEIPFVDKKFSYLIGNPPFFAIPNTEDYKPEKVFLNSFRIALDEKTEIKAKDIVGKHQISQCFFIKLKDWADDNTRFGFVSNSSNFYNDHSKGFQNFFYSSYGIEKIYELSRVKKILFEKAKESVVALIFSNKYRSNTIIDYYPVELGLFSEKPFELLIINEDKVIAISQRELIDNKVRLRDFLIGNDYDLKFVNKFNDFKNKFSTIITVIKGSKSKINNGLQIVGKEQIISEFGLTEKEYIKLDRSQRQAYSQKFKNNYTSKFRTKQFPYPFIEAKDLIEFKLKNIRYYLGDISNFHRTRNQNIYLFPKILINRTGKKLVSAVCNYKIYYNFDVYSIFLIDNSDLYFYSALINSSLLNYLVDYNYRKRLNSSFPKIGHEAILNLPLPKNPNSIIVKQISDLSQKITEGKFEYSDKENDLNELISELYELSYWEKQRIEDYFLPKERIGKKRTALKKYKSTLYELLEFYLKNSIIIDETSTDFNLKVVKISLSNNSNTPKANKAKKFILNEIFEQNPNENFLASQEKIYGKDCVFILKEDLNINWTETKAYEDAQDILKRLIFKENGERIH